MSLKDCRRTYNWISQPTRSCVASLPQRPVKDSRCTIIANAHAKQVNSVRGTAWNELAKIAATILFHVSDFAVATSRRRCLIYRRKIRKVNIVRAFSQIRIADLNSRMTFHLSFRGVLYLRAASLAPLSSDQKPRISGVVIANIANVPRQPLRISRNARFRTSSFGFLLSV